jgi:hypothetical protein
MSPNMRRVRVDASYCRHRKYGCWYFNAQILSHFANVQRKKKLTYHHLATGKNIHGEVRVTVCPMS